MNPAVVLAMIRLRLLRVARDRSGLIWLLVMPMVFSVIMGALLGGMGGGGGASSRPRFMVYDGDGGAAVDGLLAPLYEHERFLLVRADSLVAPEAARRLVEDRRITAALLVPAGFSASAAAGDTARLQLFVDGDRLSSQSVRSLLDRTALKVNTAAAARSLVVPDVDAGAAPRGRAIAFDADVFERLWEEPRVTLDVTTLGRRAEREDWGLTRTEQHVGPAYILFFMLMFMLVTAKELVRERRDRTLDRLVASRAPAAGGGGGVVGGGVAAGLAPAAILLLAHARVFKMDYGDSPAGVALTVILFAGFGAGASVLLGSVARSEAQADGLGTALTMTMGALGGLWWPLEAVPGFMQRIGGVLPTGQAITAFHDMIGRGYGVADLAPLLGGLTVWFAATLALGAWRLRRLLA